MTQTFGKRFNAQRSAKNELAKAGVTDPAEGKHFDTYRTRSGAWAWRPIVDRQPEAETFEPPAFVRGIAAGSVAPADSDAPARGTDAAAAPQPVATKQRRARAEAAERSGRKAGAKTEILVSLLKRKHGATVEELTKATGWLPHTMRARLSGLAKPPHGLKIERTRAEGVTSYRIAA